MTTNNTLQTKINKSKLTEFINLEYLQCRKDQFLREFEKNAWEAILRLRGLSNNNDFKGTIKVCTRIIKDVPKLCIIDNGIGMDDKDLNTLVKDLASSHELEVGHPNFGVGSKVSAGPMNKKGIMYESWKDGTGYRAKFGNVGEGYGLIRLNEEGRHQFSEPIEDSHESRVFAQDIIKEHGTMVTFLGNDLKDDTTLSSHWGLPKSSGWVLKYYNKRISVLDPNIEFTAPGYEGKMIKVSGLNSDSLAVNTLHKGTMPLSDGSSISWYIFKDFYKDKAADKRGRSAGSAATTYTSHSCAIMEGEVYNFAQSNQRPTVMRRCGITFAKNIALHFNLNPTTYGPNKYRTEVMNKANQTSGFFDSPEGESLMEEFANNLPQPIQDVQDRAFREAEKNRSDTSSLKKYKHLYRFSKTTVEGENQNGMETISETPAFTGGGLFPTASGPNLNKKTSLRKTTTGRKNRKGSKKSSEADNLPQIVWTGDPKIESLLEDIKDRLVDRAAEYDEVADVVFMNTEYTVYRDTLNEICRTKNNLNGWAKDAIKSIMRQCFAEAVSSHILYQKKNAVKRSWLPDQDAETKDPGALTAIVNSVFPFIIDKTLSYIQRTSTAKFQDAASPEALNGTTSRVTEYYNNQVAG